MDEERVRVRPKAEQRSTADWQYGWTVVKTLFIRQIEKLISYSLGYVSWFYPVENRSGVVRELGSIDKRIESIEQENSGYVKYSLFNWLLTVRKIVK